MKIPAWFKRLYDDSFSKWLTVFLLVGGPLWSLAQWSTGLYMFYPWDTAAFFVGFYFLVFLPIAYLNRNTK